MVDDLSCDAYDPVHTDPHCSEVLRMFECSASHCVPALRI
jgi:hypothetical protein